MRIFAALDIPLEIKNEIFRKISVKFRIKGVKLVEKENLHITLKFYGELEEHTMNEIINKYNNLLTKNLEFETKITKISAFPSEKNPRVIWLDLKNKEMFRKILEILDEWDERYIPHLTIARVKHPSAKHSVKETIKNIKSPDIKEFKISRIILFESKLYPTGPIYKPIKEWKL